MDSSGGLNCLFLIVILLVTGVVWAWFTRGGIGFRIRRDMFFGPRDGRSPGVGGIGGGKEENLSPDEKMLIERSNSRREKINVQLKRDLEALEEKEGESQ
jgi:hypothetical protein